MAENLAARHSPKLAQSAVFGWTPAAKKTMF
jgi:hypothetical protein